MLSDKGFDNRKRLTTAWCTHYPRTSEGVYHVTPTFAHPTLEIKDHRNVDAILVLYQLLTLLETLVFEVKSVLTKFEVKILRNGIEASMDTHNTCYRTDEIQQTVQTIACNSCSPMALLQENT